MDTGSTRETGEQTEQGAPAAGRETVSAAEARLLTDLRRINEATTRLEHTLAEAQHALLRARAAGPPPGGGQR